MGAGAWTCPCPRELPLGAWLDLYGPPWYVDAAHAVLPLPQRAGIIRIEERGVTVEPSLLEVRTRHWAEVFGWPVKGTLDVSNMRVSQRTAAASESAPP